MNEINFNYEKKPTYKEVYKFCQDLFENHNCVQMFDIGKSTLKQPIPALGIGNLESPVLFAAGFHALEWLTILLMLKFIEDVVYCYEKRIKDGKIFNKELFDNQTIDEKNFDKQIDIRQILDKRGLIVVPLVNCDGLDLSCSNLSNEDIKKKYSKYADTIIEIIKKDKDALSKWQANIRGVDLNHNYNAGYDILKKMEQTRGIIKPTFSLYGGKTFESEKETKVMVKLLKNYNFVKVFAFHSQGKEIYYSYGVNTPPQSKYIAEILGKMTCYTVCSPEGMASYGGFKDYFIEKYSKPGFTFEIGEGKNPLPASDLPEIYKDLKNALALSLIL